jgi:hypothetical protein
MSSLSKATLLLVDHLKKGNVNISFKPDTILAPIAGQLLAPIEDAPVESTEAAVSKVNDYLDKNSPNVFTSSLEETALFGNPVEVGVQAVKNDLLPIALGITEKIKNSIIPATNDIFEKAYEAVSSTVDNGGVNLNIVTDGQDLALYQNPALLAILDGYSEESVGALLGNIYFPILSAETLLTAIHSVNASLNSSLDEALGANAESIVTNAYIYYFNVDAPRISSRDFLDVNDRLIDVAALLLTVAFSEDIPDGITGVDEPSQYRNALDKLCARLVNQVRNTIRYGINVSKTGRLVLRWPEDGSEFAQNATIVVNGRIYNEWLENGGTVDIIYGSYADNKEANAVTLQEKKDYYERAWYRYVAAKQSALKDDFERIFVSALRKEIFAYASANGYTVIDKGIEKLYERETSINPDCAYGFARRAVVNSLFGDGDYLNVLEEIDHIAETTPGISFEDATELGIIDWLASWVVSTLDIKKSR